MRSGAIPELPITSATRGAGETVREDETGRSSALCDTRLAQLNIAFWTSVPIGNGLASRAISLYLQTDHPLLGTFDPDLFINDLVSQQGNYCSSVLVNALLYWACVSHFTKVRG